MDRNEITITTLDGTPITMDTKDAPGVIVGMCSDLGLESRAALNTILYHDGAAALCTHVALAISAGRGRALTRGERASLDGLIEIVNKYRAAMRVAATGAA